MAFVAVVLSGHALRRAHFERSHGPMPTVVDLETSRKDPDAVFKDSQRTVDVTRKLLATEPEDEPKPPTLLSRVHPLRKHGFPGIAKSEPVEPAPIASAANSPSDDANAAKKAVKTLRFA